MFGLGKTHWENIVHVVGGLYFLTCMCVLMSILSIQGIFMTMINISMFWTSSFITFAMNDVFKNACHFDGFS